MTATLDLERSREVSAVVHAMPKHCWQNSMDALETCYRDHPSAFYVEGWAVTEYGLVVEHGWVEVDGRIIDPTPSWNEVEEGDRAYFAGVRYTLKEMRKERRLCLKEDRWTPFVHRHGWGWDHAGYRAAYVAATRHAYPPGFAEVCLKPLLTQYPEEG